MLPTILNKPPTPNLVFDDELEEFRCIHPDAYIEKACCSGSGLIECGCGGMDSVHCPAGNCTGIQDHEVDALFESLQSDPEDGYYE